MEEYRLLCESFSWCNSWWHMAMVILFLGLPPLPFILAILLGPTPAEKERQRQALAARCCHDHACCHTHPAKRQASLTENPLC